MGQNSKRKRVMDYAKLFDWIARDISAHYARLCYREKEFEQFVQYKECCASVKNTEEFAQNLNTALWELKDNHIRVRPVHGKTLETYPGNLTSNYSTAYYARLLKTDLTTVKRATLLHKRINENTLYILINSFSKNRGQVFLKELPRIKEKLGIVENVIIDVRRNQGGSDRTGAMVWSLFLPKGEKKLARILKYRADPENPHEFYEYHDYIQGTLEKTFEHKNVIVLCGRRTESAAERFVLSMKAAGATVIGDNTGGTSGRPMAHIFGPVEIDIPTWVSCEADGASTFDTGVKPHVRIDPEKAPVTPEKDPVLEKALARAGD